MDKKTDMNEEKSPDYCPEKPERFAGQPLGMYHCPYCGEIQMAGLPPIDCKYKPVQTPTELEDGR